MFLIILLYIISIASAASIFSNSTSTALKKAATLPTVSITSVTSTSSNSLTAVSQTPAAITASPTSVSPSNTGLYVFQTTEPFYPCVGVPLNAAAGPNCLRTGYPYYYYPRQWFSPRYTNDVEDKALSSCSAVYQNELNRWLETAPITFGSSTIPETVVWMTISAFTTTNTWFNPIAISFDSSSSIVAEYEVSHVPGGVPVRTQTTTLVDSVGVQRVQTITYDMETLWQTAGNVMSRSEYSTEVSTQLGTSKIYYTQAAFAQASYILNFTHTPTGTCCIDCTLFGDKVQVYFWPTPAHSPPIATLVDSSNFTFISPSIYVAFESIYATDICGPVGSGVGTATTLAFHKDALSTDTAYRYNTDQYASPPWLPPLYTLATWGVMRICEDIITSFWQHPYATHFSIGTYPPTFSGPETADMILYTVTYNPCSPSISVPTEIFTMNTLWSTCSQGMAGLFDPPYVLTVGNGLSAFTSTALPLTATKESDAPAAAPGPTLPPPVPPTTQKPSVTQTQVSIPSSKIPSDPPGGGRKALVITIDGSTITANSASAFIIGSQTLTKGSQITYSGSILSLDPQGSSLYISEATNSDTPKTGSNDPPSNDPAESAAHPSITAAPIIIGSQSLIPGGAAITVSGTQLSLQPDGNTVIVNGSPVAADDFFSTVAKMLVGPQTLIAGGSAILISGTTVSWQADGLNVVVGSQTQSLSEFMAGASTTTSSGGIGEIIEVIGGFTTQMANSTGSAEAGEGSGWNGETFEGRGHSTTGRSSKVVWIWVGVLVVGLIGMGWL